MQADDVWQRAWRSERAQRLALARQLADAEAALRTSAQEREQALCEQQREQQREQRLLAQTEKMVSLGVLAAGIAHEINNPVGFVTSNLATLRDYHVATREAFDALRTLALHIPDRDPLAAERDAVLAQLRSVDIDFVLGDAAACVDETLVGLERVRAIVAGLKAFARTESDTLEPTDVHAVLESALVLLQNQTKHACDIVRDYGDLPPVLANPGKLTQVFVNLIGNAVQAIEEKANGTGSCGDAGKGAWGVITLRTRVEGAAVTIAVSDTGCGIPPAVRARLFQPFFTTKPVGQGTGLGLAISFGIVSDLGGAIDVTSTFGEGACFTVRLPLEDG